MKLLTPCMQCFQEQGHPSEEMISAELFDDGLLRVHCLQGHTTIAVIQEQKHEILFDHALMALIDGYPREAATGMAATLERFYEFVLKVLCKKHGIEASAYKNSWKSISAQSERQFGAFLFAWLIEFGAPPSTIDDIKPKQITDQKWERRKWKEFRNYVVHKGYMPSYAETVVYGDLVFSHIQHLTSQLNQRCADAVQVIQHQHLQQKHQQARTECVHLSTMSIPAILSRHTDKEFDQTIEEVRQYKARMYHV